MLFLAGSRVKGPHGFCGGRREPCPRATTGGHSGLGAWGVLCMCEHVCVSPTQCVRVVCVGVSVTSLFYLGVPFAHKPLFALMVENDPANSRCVRHFGFKTWSSRDISATSKDTSSTFSFFLSQTPALCPHPCALCPGQLAFLQEPQSSCRALGCPSGCPVPGSALVPVPAGPGLVPCTTCASMPCGPAHGPEGLSFLLYPRVSAQGEAPAS